MSGPDMPDGPSGGPEGSGMQDGLDNMREEEAEDEEEQIPEDMPTPEDAGMNPDDAQYVETSPEGLQQNQGQQDEPSPDDSPADMPASVVDHDDDPRQIAQENQQESEQSEDQSQQQPSPDQQSTPDTTQSSQRGDSQTVQGDGPTQGYPYSLAVEKLPSEGRLYRHKTIDMRLINSKEEVRIKNATPRSMTTVIQDVIQGCTKQDILDLTYGDRLWLYLQLRVESFHQYCYLEVQCPHCDKKDPQYPVDLYDLDTRPLPKDFEEPMQYRGEDVDLVLRMLRLRDVNKVNDWLKMNANKDKWEEMDFGAPELNELARSACMVDEHPDAGRNITQKVDWLVTAEEDGGCSRTEWRILKAFENRYSHGVDFDVVQQCRHCEGDISITVPMKPQLIYPDPTDAVDLDEFRVEKGTPTAE